jgi:uncharacterized protein (UPF0548 family)
VKAISEQIAAAAELPSASPPLMSALRGLHDSQRLPFAFAHDHMRSVIGNGPEAFARAKTAFRNWAMFDLGWVRVANPEADIAAGQLVAVEAHTLGLWTINLSRIIEVVDAPNRFGFLYGTTKKHVEQGEERFFLGFDPTSGDVSYLLEAVSRPSDSMARLGFFFTRACQHRFARDSHQRMKDNLLATRSMPGIEKLPPP